MTKPYQQIKCGACDGHGIRQNGNHFDPSPEECRWCAGNGTITLYASGVMASYPSGPLIGRLTKQEIAERFQPEGKPHV